MSSVGSTERSRVATGADPAAPPRTHTRLAGAVLVAIILVTLVLHVAWLVRFRRGYVTEWDESGYLQFSLSNYDALRIQGVWKSWRR